MIHLHPRDTWPLNQKLEVPQGAEFNPECSGSDKTMAVTASIEAAAAATALSSSSSNGLNGIRTWYPRNNKGLGSKFQSSRVRDKPEEGQRIRRPKRCGKNNLDEEVSPKSIINENTSSQKYRQLLLGIIFKKIHIIRVLPEFRKYVCYCLGYQENAEEYLCIKQANICKELLKEIEP